MGSVSIFVITITILVHSTEKNSNCPHIHNRNSSTNLRCKLTLKELYRYILDAILYIVQNGCWSFFTTAIPCSLMHFSLSHKLYITQNRKTNAPQK